MKTKITFLVLLALLVAAFLADIVLGSVHLSLSEVWGVFTGGEQDEV